MIKGDSPSNKTIPRMSSALGKLHQNFRINFCNTPHLKGALKANFGLKVGIILFYQELKVDFLLGLSFCFDFGTIA